MNEEINPITANYLRAVKEIMTLTEHPPEIIVRLLEGKGIDCEHLNIEVMRRSAIEKLKTQKGHESLTRYCRALAIAAQYSATHTPEELGRILIGRGIDIGGIDLNLLHYNGTKTLRVEIDSMSEASELKHTAIPGDVREKLRSTINELLERYQSPFYTGREDDPEINALRARIKEFCEGKMPLKLLTPSTVRPRVQRDPMDHVWMHRDPEVLGDIMIHIAKGRESGDYKLGRINGDDIQVTRGKLRTPDLKDGRFHFVNFDSLNNADVLLDEIFKGGIHRGMSTHRLHPSRLEPAWYLPLFVGVKEPRSAKRSLIPSLLSDFHIGSGVPALGRLTDNPFLYWPKTCLMAGDHDGNVGFSWADYEKAKRIKNKRRRKHRKENRRGKQWRR